VSAPGRLVVCPTPIGNLEDITLRTLGALREASVIACEDTRTTKVLLDRHGVDAERVRYDAHAERRAAPRLVERMLAGEVVALVSDAGMPLVSDPGAGFDPKAVPNPLEGDNLLKPGGRGVFLINQMMDTVEFRDEGRQVVMRKHPAG